MAKVTNIDEAMEQYGGTNGFFALEDDENSATVRILHHDINDSMFDIVHEVKIDNRNQWVQCTQEPDCKLCKSGKAPIIRLFIQLELPNGDILIWDRGKKMIKDIQSKYNQYGPLFNRMYEIIRHGRKGDTNTTYEIVAFEADEPNFDDLPERIEVCKPEPTAIVWPMSYYEQVLSNNRSQPRQYAEPRARQVPAEDVF